METKSLTGEVEITLKHPIEVNGISTDRLRLRRVTVGDLEVMAREKTELERSIRLLSLAAGLSPDDTRKMDAADFSKASESVAGFLA